ncbi:MAG: hypothetical protein HY791_33865 [Deltaproteobacteria bacterium]|nr:hypothetical protein [Deltaproteobacteria bacterium]
MRSPFHFPSAELRWQLTLLGLAACSSEVAVRLDGDAVLAVAHSAGRAERVSIGSLQQPFRFDAEDSEAALFALDGSDFWIGHPKRPAGSGEVAHFFASLEREPREGSCSACSTPSRANPQLLFEGEPCPIPPFLDAVDSEGAPVSPDVVAALRAQVRLSHGDECKSSRPITPSEVAYEYEILDPRVDAEPIESVGLAGAAIGMFSERIALIVDESGRRVERREGLPFRGSITSVAGLEDGSFLVASHDVRNLARSRFDLFGPDLTHEPLELGPTPIGVSELEVVGDRIFVAGETSPGQQSGKAALFRCERSGQRLVCETQSAPRQLHNFSRVDLDTSGRFAVVGSKKAALGLVDQGAESVCDFSYLGESATGVDVALLSDRALVCVNSAAGGALLVARWPEPGDECSSLMSHRSHCRVVVATSSSSALAFFADGSAYELRGDEEPTRRADLDMNARRAFDHARGSRARVVFSNLDGSVWKLEGGALARVFGTQTQPEGISSVLRRPLGGFYAVQSSTVTLVTPEGELGERARIPGLEPSDRILGASVDSSIDGLAFVVRRGQLTCLLRAQLSAAESECLRLPNIAIGPIVEARPGTHVLATESFGLLRAEGAQISPIAVDFDDPRTNELETRPNVPSLEIRALDASDGVVWVVGDQALVFRVVPFGEPVAERISVPAELSSADDSASRRLLGIRAVRAFGPGHALFAASELINSRPDLARVLEVSARPSGPEVTLYPFNGVPSRPNGGAAGTPTAVIGPPSAVAVLTVSDSVRPTTLLNWMGSAGAFFRMLTAFERGAADENGVVLLGGTGGRLVLGTPSD